MNLPAFRFYIILDNIREERENHIMEQYRAAAFTSWQILNGIAAMLGQDPGQSTFNEYLEKIGLLDEKEKKAIEQIRAMKKEVNHKKINQEKEAALRKGLEIAKKVQGSKARG